VSELVHAEAQAGDLDAVRQRMAVLAELRPIVDSTCRANGYEPPILCTPDELMGD